MILKSKNLGLRFYSKIKKINKKDDLMLLLPSLFDKKPLKLEERTWAKNLDFLDFRGEEPGSGKQQSIFWQEKLKKQQEEFAHQVALKPSKRYPLLLDLFYIETAKDKVHRDDVLSAHPSNKKNCYFGLYIEELDSYDKDDFRQLCYYHSPFLSAICCKKNICNRPKDYSIFMEPPLIDNKSLREKTFKSIAPSQFYIRNEARLLKEKLKPKKGICVFGLNKICDFSDNAEDVVCLICGKVGTLEEFVEYHASLKEHKEDLALEKAKLKQIQNVFYKNKKFLKLRILLKKKKDNRYKRKKKKYTSLHEDVERKTWLAGKTKKTSGKA